jgi:hypothetical protein
MCVLVGCPPPLFVPPLSLGPLFLYGNTALIYASYKGHAKVVELLLAAKADKNHQNIVSPLHPLRERE